MLTPNGRSFADTLVESRGSTLLVLVAVLVLAVATVTACSSSKSGGKGAAGTTEANATVGPLPACTQLPPAGAFPILAKPPADVPANQAAFSGAWEGKTNDFTVGLVVLSVNAKEATSTYFYGPLSGGLVSQFQPDGSLHQGGTQQIQFTWTLGPTGTTMLGTRKEGSAESSFVMKKCTLQP